MNNNYDSPSLDNKLTNSESNITIQVNSYTYAKPKKYNYGYKTMEEILENPEEYIIPECLKTCRNLWDKNIETFLSSSYDDTFLYVLFIGLSAENRAIFKKLMEKFPDYYSFNKEKGAYCISINEFSNSASKKLETLTTPFKLQDTFRYKSEKAFLEAYKKTNGTLQLINNGNSRNYTY